jgi:ABC-type sugar transport system permease subunit
MIVRGKRHWWQFLTHPGLVLAMPAIILYTAFFVWPALQAFYVSMTDWSGFAPQKVWVGFANFKELFYEQLYWRAVLNNFVFMFGVGIAMFTFALLFSAVLSNRNFFGRKFFKTVLFAPYVVSVVAIAVLWTFIYDPKWGLLNSILSLVMTDIVRALHAMGLTQMTGYQVGILWLGSWGMSILSMSFVMVWGGIGFYVILLIAGIDRIPDDYYEAARIDGASEKQSFFYITLPLLREVLIIAISIHIIGSLKQFGLVWAMTRGTNYTHTMETYMYDVAFEPRTMSFRMGYGTAMTVVLFFMVVLLTFTFNWITRRQEVEY